MKKLVFLVLLFITSLSFGQAIDSSKWIRNDGSFNYNNWKVRNNLIIPTKTDTSNKISGLTQIIGTDLYFVATDHKWKTYISDTSGIHTQLVNQLAAIQANASAITGKQSQLNGNGFVKATGTTISYDNTSYFPAAGGVLSGTAGNGYVGFTPQSTTPAVPSSGFKLFASSAGAFSWLTTQGYMRELRIRNQNQDFIGYFQNKPSYTLGDSADIAAKADKSTTIKINGITKDLSGNQDWGTIGGSSGGITSLTAGLGLTGGTITSSGTVALDTAYGKKYFGWGLSVPNDSTVIVDSNAIKALSVAGGGASSQWTTSGSDIYYQAGNVAVGSSTTGAGTFSVTKGGLGTTQTSISGINLRNTTAAALGAQQISPALTFLGQGWSTTASKSDSIGYRMYMLPGQGGSTTPSLLFQSLATTGVATTQATLDAVGGWTTNGVFTSNATSGNNFFTSNLYLGNSTTQRYIGFAGSPGRAVIGTENVTGNIHFRTNDAASLSTGAAALVIGNSTGDLLVNSTTFDNSALLNLVSTGKGMLPPRMTAAQRDAINLTISSVNITNGGTGYTTTITVAATAPYGGISATFGSVVKSGNVITSIPVATGGSYNSTPTVTITGGGGTGATATANMTQVLTPGLTVYCTDCTATDTSTGVMQTYNGTAWKNNW